MVPVSCELCSSLGAKTEYWTLDDRKTHSQFHAFQLGYVSENGDQPSVKEIFGKCFPSEDFEKPKEFDKTRSTLTKICQRIIAAKKNQSKSIKCQICESKVRYLNNKGVQRTELILRHACTHSTKKPFVCRECQCEMAIKSNIVGHIKNIHKIASPVSGVDFDENWLACFDDVKESLTQSFIRLNLDPAWRVKNRTPLSELSIQRRMIFSKILKNANIAKKIQCHQCQVEICATCNANLEDHIRFHLQRRIYDCAMCKSTFIHKRDISKHLGKKHDAPRNGNYIDHSDEHHEEIVEWANKCFVKEESK